MKSIILTILLISLKAIDARECLTEVDFLLPKGTFPHAEYKDYFAAIRNGEVIFFNLPVAEQDILPPRHGLKLSDYFPGSPDNVKLGIRNYFGNVTLAVNNELFKVYKWSSSARQFTHINDMATSVIFPRSDKVVDESYNLMDFNLDAVVGSVYINPRSIKTKSDVAYEEVYSILRLPNGRFVVLYAYRQENRRDKRFMPKWTFKTAKARDSIGAGFLTSAVFDKNLQKYFVIIDRTKYVFLNDADLRKFVLGQVLPGGPDGTPKPLADLCIPFAPVTEGGPVLVAEGGDISDPEGGLISGPKGRLEKSKVSKEKKSLPVLGIAIAAIAVVAIVAVVFFALRGKKKVAPTNDGVTGGRSELFAN